MAATAPKWSSGKLAARAKTLISDVESREREALRSRMRLVRVARTRAVKRIRSWARSKLAALRARAQLVRQRCLAKIRAASARHAELVRQRRALLVAKAERRFTAVHARRKRELAEAIRAQRLVRERERRSLKSRTTARERRQESDDQVRHNLDPDMVPIFNVVAASIKGTPKMTRTESFLHWVHDNPDEVIRMRSDMAAQEVDRWLKEEHERERKEKRQAGEQGIIWATWRNARFSVREAADDKGNVRYSLLMTPTKGRRHTLRWSLSVRGDDWTLGTPEPTARGPSKPSREQTALARHWVDSLDGYRPLDDLSDVPF